MKNVVTRFAPSPTGRLHLGHAYSALLAHRFARSREGQFLLRIEDIDPGRSRIEHVDAILEDLLWLGLEPDGEIVYQSERLPLYAEALERLREEGLVYPCFCTRSAIAAEVAASAAAPHGPEGSPYPGTCRKLAQGEREDRVSTEPHSWRLDVGAALRRTGPLRWHDAEASYHLAVTVDDAAQDVTDVVRGRDLFASTHVHRLLQELLGLPVPRYHHHKLLVDAQGRRLAKRHGAAILADLRAAGADPGRLAADLLAGKLPAGYSPADT
jgi:glutamyl-Q tRNA(Asp) synthetase